MANKFIFDDSYIQGELGEAVARGELNLTRLHNVTMSKLQNFVTNGKLSPHILKLINDYRESIDCLKIIESSAGASIEFYEVKTRLTGFKSFTNSRRKPKITDSTLELHEKTTSLGLKMYSVIVDFFPYWRYNISVKPFSLDDFSISSSRQKK